MTARTIDNQVEQKKAQYNLGRQTALSSGNVDKYKFLTGEDVL